MERGQFIHLTGRGTRGFIFLKTRKKMPRGVTPPSVLLTRLIPLFGIIRKQVKKPSMSPNAPHWGLKKWTPNYWKLCSKNYSRWHPNRLIFIVINGGGGLVIWDNRCLMHIACGGVPKGQIRHMHRTIFRGDTPY